MRRRTALQAAALGVVAAAAGAGLTARGEQARTEPSVLLLGDSLTWGQTGPGASLPGGFRAPLHALLREQGVPHRFAGSRRDNGTDDLVRAGQDAHEGWPGYRVDQAAGLPLPAADVALVLLGTNDVHQGHPARPTARRLRALVRDLPVRDVVVVAPPPYLRDPHDRRPDPVSAALARALPDALGPRTPLVDAWSPFVLPDGTADRDLVAPDGTHLTATGYARLAALVAAPLGAALRRV